MAQPQSLLWGILKPLLLNDDDKSSGFLRLISGTCINSSLLEIKIIICLHVDTPPSFMFIYFIMSLAR